MLAPGSSTLLSMDNLMLSLWYRDRRRTSMLLT